MDDGLIFYTHPMSRGRIARWMLEELGEPYTTEIVDYGPPMKSTDYLVVNPMGKVPALRHGQAIVTECAAICAYLADAFPRAGLAPPSGDASRGPYYRWLFFAAGPLEAAVTNKAMGFEVPDDKRGTVGYGAFTEVIDALDGLLSSADHVTGDSFSAADVYLGSHLGWGMQFGTIEPRPAFKRYWERLSNRPAAVRARAIDDALLPAHPIPARPA